MSLLRRIDSKPADQKEPPPNDTAAGPPVPVMSQLPVRESFREDKYRVLQRVIGELDPNLNLNNEAEVRQSIETTFRTVVEDEGLPLTRGERARLLEQIVDEIIGLGPLEPLL